jgi:hypothetical protein
MCILLYYPGFAVNCNFRIAISTCMVMYAWVAENRIFSYMLEARLDISKEVALADLRGVMD